MKYYLKIFKSLGEKARIRILKILSKAQLPLCVCEIVDSLQLPFYTVSKHLKELKNSEMVNETKEGTFVMYSLNKSDFILKVIDLINGIPEEYFENDIKLLNKRLSLRENGKCIIGVNKEIQGVKL